MESVNFRITRQTMLFDYGKSFPHTLIDIREECGLVFVLLGLHHLLELQLRRGDRVSSFLVSWNLKSVDVRIVNWLALRWIAMFLSQSDGKRLCTLSRRPPPRGRRRPCASASNPKPQPSIISENLTRYPASVCGSSTRLAADRE